MDNGKEETARWILFTIDEVMVIPSLGGHSIGLLQRDQQGRPVASAKVHSEQEQRVLQEQAWDGRFARGLPSGEPGYCWTYVPSRLECISLFVENGYDVNEQDFFGRTPLHWACIVGSTSAVEYLVSKGADISIRTFVAASPHADG